ncbi:MAG: dephospho-CoA kinase [Candidatus Paceibacteria bacterium]|jgi:dephospho-CoA kinase|tara:strand:- start:102 stop:695 length:594 start_codon:yes stop_codon:yes gene_type:complete
MIVGLTGGIGSGKSAVSAQLQALGILVVDADQVAREVVLVGSPALHSIAKHFGTQILHHDGCLNRAALRQQIFADKTQRQWLEALLHPLIGVAIKEQLAGATSLYAVLESPLLLETAQHKTTDFVVVVDASESLQRQRACQRDGSTKLQIDAIISSQMPRQQRLDKAHWVLDNQHDLDHLSAQVLKLHDHLCHITEH